MRIICRVLGTALLGILLINPGTALAITDAQRNVTRSGIRYFNTETSEPNTCSATALSTSENTKAAYAFFISKGLTPVQAAGLMGNIQGESHFETRLVEYGFKNSRGEISVPGKPSSLDEVIPPDQNSLGQPGYGLVQWSGGRKQGLADFAQSQDKAVFDISLQLDNIWRELTSSYTKTALDPLRAATTIEDTTSIILNHYEIPGDKAKAYSIRLPLARGFLTLYGSSSPDSSGASSGSSCANLGNFSYGKYSSMSRQELIDIILNAPNWKPQSQNPVNDIKSGIAVDNLLRLLAALVENLPNELITPSVIQTGHECRVSGSASISNHMGGLAVDLGGAGHTVASMNTIFTWLYSNSAALGINELIFDPVPAGTTTLKDGKLLVYNAGTREQHQNHIHVSVKGKAPTTCPAGA